MKVEELIGLLEPYKDDNFDTRLHLMFSRKN